MLNQYLQSLTDTATRGDAREESYYSALETLIKAYAAETGRQKVDVTTLPKQTEAGNPDFRIWDGKQHITGYIEAKVPGTNLQHIEQTEQLKRYRSTFPNLILTDFFEFRLYRDGELVEKVQVARSFIAGKLGAVPPIENEDAFKQLLERYFSFRLPKIYAASSLAVELAKRTRFLRDEVVRIELAEEERKGQKALRGFYEAFKEYLIGTISEEQFADLYSQTITYGLFAARTRADGNFTRETAYSFIPKTIGILRDVFRFISLEEPPKALRVIVDDIAEVLEVTDVKKILKQYYESGKGRDPIVHFYETFLAKYDPKTRESRGVYYTPEPVVGFIVRSLHHLLKTRFGKADGFASEGVTVLDPAAGTLTFPAEAVRLAIEEYTGKYGEGGKEKFIKNHLLKNFYAFELMMAPYAIGHLKMSFILEELGYRMDDDERFELYLTNALEMEPIEQTQIPGLSTLSEESHAASRVKNKKPILVVMGNPPYSGHSANPSDVFKYFNKGDEYIGGYRWNEKKEAPEPIFKKASKNDLFISQKNFIGEQLMRYFFVDGAPLGERNSKWLQDDYVKFIRFSQWKIDQNGEGTLGFITNHSYLDNPTFRGMRESLLQTFNEIYIVDLHGNQLKGETTPEGGLDENVFNIRQGTAIAILIKNKGKKGCKVFHKDVYGRTNEKYDWLDGNSVETIKWQELKPQKDFYVFIPQDNELQKKYQNFLKINEIFPVNNSGIITKRDFLNIHYTKEDVLRMVKDFVNLKEEVVRLKYKLPDDVRDWKYNWALADLKKAGIDEEYVKPIHYRPFDVRYLYYTGISRGIMGWPVYDVMKHMLHENIAIITSRQAQDGFKHAFVSQDIIEFNLTGSAGKYGSGYIFPLYLYQEQENQKKTRGGMMMLFEPEEKNYGKRPNISKEVFAMLEKAFGNKPNPERIFGYTYAVLYSNFYREKYADFLRGDFPRIPFTANKKLFLELSSLGQRLIDLHLLKSSELDSPVARYQGSGSDTVEKPVYDEDRQRVYINPDKYFEGITPQLWNYHIGGYQVLHKYLKDRKGRSMDDPRHYIRTATSLARTIELQQEIDALYEGVEENVIDKE